MPGMPHERKREWFCKREGLEMTNPFIAKAASFSVSRGKRAKDCAAGAVLLCALGAVGTGVVVFGAKLVARWGG